ncbi:MAG: symmetrical bis(5'-nucleosyl)-tetraphosphatase [bacterium]|nr:symmetrical bis(5'-nucleosyl)-tetraphosphatase [bacterium]
MSDYAIGDLQGCYEPLQRLLQFIDFDEQVDRLWFVGDLVNRGPESLAVLRFIKSLPIKPQITLGNHDLHLLASLFGGRPWQGHDDTIHEVMHAPDGEELGHWLRSQSILCYSPELNVVMCHAGIAPMWNLSQAMGLAQELETVLSGGDYESFLQQMYGNNPTLWSDKLQGMERLRLITNYFTRMRFCSKKGQLDLTYNGTIAKAPSQLYPWYDVPNRQAIDVDIIFGHWAALMGVCSKPNIHAIDTGCLWGGPLTALRLQDKKRFSVPGYQQ